MPTTNSEPTTDKGGFIEHRGVLGASEFGYQNWGRCPICGDEHILNENGEQCGKG